MLLLLKLFLTFDREGGVNAELKVVLLYLDVHRVDSKNIMDFVRNPELADVLWFSNVDPGNQHFGSVVEEVLQMCCLTGLFKLNIIA
jgi:hypothetical protein